MRTHTTQERCSHARLRKVPDSAPEIITPPLLERCWSIELPGSDELHIAIVAEESAGSPFVVGGIPRDILGITNLVSQFGEVQKLDLSHFQFDSSFYVSYFDIRATSLAKHLVQTKRVPGLSIVVADYRSNEFISTTTSTPDCARKRSLQVVGEGASLMDFETMSTIFGKFGDVDSVNQGTRPSVSVVRFYDSRSPLSIYKYLGKETHLDSSQDFQVSVSDLVTLLLASGGDSARMITNSSVANPNLGVGSLGGLLPTAPNRRSTSPTSRSSSADTEAIGNRRSPHAEFIVNLRQIENGIDSRTTVMVRNIPRTFSQSVLINVLEVRFSTNEMIDFMYLPMDLMAGVNVGYAFINVKNPLDVITLFNCFNNKSWKVLLDSYLPSIGSRAYEPDASNKTCKITFARLQGLQSLSNHFKTASIMNQPDSIRPYFGPTAGGVSAPAHRTVDALVSKSIGFSKTTTQNPSISRTSTSVSSSQLPYLED